MRVNRFRRHLLERLCEDERGLWYPNGDRIQLAAAPPVAAFIRDAGFTVTGRLVTWRGVDRERHVEDVVLASVASPPLPQLLPDLIVTAAAIGTRLSWSPVVGR